MAQFDLLVRVNPWAGETAVPIEDALSGVVWSIEVNGHRIARTPDRGASLALDPFPTLWLEKVDAPGWAALAASPDDLAESEEDGWVGIPIRTIEFVFEPWPYPRADPFLRDLLDHDRSTEV